MIDLKKHAYEIEVLGFTIVEDFLSRAESAGLSNILDAALEEDAKRFQGNPYKKYSLIPNLALAGPAFLRLLDHEVMHAIYSHFLGDTCVLYTYSSTLLRPNETVDASKIHVDSPRLIPCYTSGLQMTLALSDFTPDNGATWYLPGSHRLEATPSAETFHRYAIQTSRPAGAALFWNPRVFHKAGENRTSEIRYGLSTYAVRSYMKPRFDFPRCLKDTDLSALSPRVKRFLGFDVRVPASMEEFYVDPKDRLYKANQG
jgi:ectoine hydroxylase-related dioxygenase (phytanoyl-CoA dioxygenase family)